MRRLAILALSALFALVGQHVLELVHALTVVHVRCAEHGELLDFEGSNLPKTRAPGLSASPSAAAAQHAHCAVDWLAQFQVATAGPTFAAPPIEVTAAPDGALTTASCFPLLSYAPKTSPPASS